MLIAEAACRIRCGSPQENGWIISVSEQFEI